MSTTEGTTNTNESADLPEAISCYSQRTGDRANEDILKAFKRIESASKGFDPSTALATEMMKVVDAHLNLWELTSVHKQDTSDWRATYRRRLRARETARELEGGKEQARKTLIGRIADIEREVRQDIDKLQ